MDLGNGTSFRNEVLAHAVTWMNPKNTLSERSQTQRSHFVGSLLYKMSRICKCIERTDQRLLGWREGEMGIDCTWQVRGVFMVESLKRERAGGHTTS